jgi:anaerobic selenocysteine-containing dehydrogenase
VATVPDQQRIISRMQREDLFTVVFEQVMTDTALYADVVLPATTFLEGYDFAKSYGTDQPRSGAAGRRSRSANRVPTPMCSASSARAWAAGGDEPRTNSI